MTGERDLGLDLPVAANVGQADDMLVLDDLLKSSGVGLPGNSPTEDPESPEYQSWVLADRLLLSNLPVEKVNGHFVEIHEIFRILPGASEEQKRWVDRFSANDQDLLRVHKGLQVPEGQLIRNNPLVPVVA